MLILTRRINESIIINVGEELIKIKYLEKNSELIQIRLGIDAPKHINIYREEIWNKILREEGIQF